MPTNADRLIELLHEARGRPAGAERERFLAEACGGDRAMLDQVTSLIEAHERAGGFLQLPPFPPPGLYGQSPGQPGDRLGPYRLGPVLGEGGCGVVYLAEQEEPIRRQVALKVIKLGMDTRAVVARFDAERQALARMDHPSIARVFDAGTTATGRPFFVMELVRGSRITEYCDQSGLPLERRLRLFIQVCQAVQHAHQKGVIHRDLKPSNVLVATQDGVPVPKVIDFGIAKATTDQRLTDLTLFTVFEQFLGTPAYMSPEQAGVSGAGQGDIDTRSDIYSLGVLLYELLTGATPFEDHELTRSGPDGFRQVLRDQEPPRPSTRLMRPVPTRVPTIPHRPRIEPDLDWIVLKCLERDRSRRYQTANGLAADLERYLNHEPVVARPPSTAYRIQKAFQRNRLAFSAAAAVALSLVVGLGASLRQTAEANRARESASRARHLAERQNYALRLTSIRHEWQENNLKLVRQALADTAQDPNRGFEWYYWQHQLHSEARVLHGHLAPVVAVDFSPDGASLVTASLDRTARVWDIPSGAERIVFRGHYREVRAVDFSPEGAETATAGADRTIRIWNAATGSERLRIRGHEDTVMSVAYSPDGRLLASGGLDGTARLWDPLTGASLGRFHHPGQVWSVRFSHDSRRVVIGCGDETALVWDVTSGDRLRVFQAPSSREIATEASDPSGTIPFTAGFSPDDRHIVTGSRNQTVRVWDADTGLPEFTLAHGSERLSPLQWDIPFPVAIAPDGRWLVTGQLDHTARQWSLVDRTEGLTFKGHDAEVAAVAVSPDGRWVAAGGFDHTARIWDANRNPENVRLDGHLKTVPVAAYSRDGARVVTGSWDGTARVWDTSDGRHLRTLDHGTNHSLWAVSFSPDARWIFTGGTDRIIRRWDAATVRVDSTLEGHRGPVLSIVVLTGGRRLLSGAADGTARVWDLATGKVLFELIEDRSMVYAAAASPDGRYLVTASIPEVTSTAGHRILATDPNGNVDLQFQGPAHVWDGRTGRKLFPLVGHLGGVSHASFSPDGRFIVTSSFDGTARIWEASTGRQVNVLEGHSGRVVFGAFFPDGRRIVTGGFDNPKFTTRVWDTETGQELLVITGSLAVGVSPDGRHLLVGGYPPHGLLVGASEDEVGRWSNEEQAARMRLQEEHRRQAETARELRKLEVRDWLLLGPFPYQGKDGTAALDQPILPNEQTLRPRAGDRAETAAASGVWAAVHQDELRLDLQRIFGQPHEHTVTYGVCYLRCNSERRDLLMHVGTDDQALILLNGREVYRHVDAKAWHADRDTVEGITLNPGVNVLVLKLVNVRDEASASVRFTGPSGEPVSGIRMTLDPSPTPQERTL